MSTPTSCLIHLSCVELENLPKVMPTSGGSANLNGILFQILGTLDRATSWTIIFHAADQELGGITLVTDAQLTIEPKGGGGDLQIRSGGHRIVEQWKIKSDRGTWSLRDLITDVLPDLYCGVDADHLDEGVKYTFVTQGRRGRWQEAESFFNALASKAVPDDPLQALDDTEMIRFLPGKDFTRRELFKTIAAAVVQRPRFQGEPPQLTHRKLWHLLSRFRIVEGIEPADLEGRIDERLTELVEHIEDVRSKRLQLCGLILQLASQAEVQITPTELLAKAGLRARSLAAIDVLSHILRERLHYHLQVLGYRTEEDVRNNDLWPADKRVIVYSGESGQGKTWKLAKHALNQAANSQAVAWVTSSGAAERDLNSAAAEVWHYGLDHDDTLPLYRIAARRQAVTSTTVDPWLTVYVDDVQLAQEARFLAEQNWQGLQARLVMSAPPFVAQSLKTAHPDLVHVVTIQDFSALELQEYLHRRGKDWTVLPVDVRATLRRPLLAKLYCDVAPTAHWLPINEYALFKQWWDTVIHRLSPDHPTDVVLMRKLAITALDEAVPYPWTAAKLVELGIGSETRRRLEEAGWLRRSGEETIELWHDRLLNWSVAEALINHRLSRDISAEHLMTTVAGIYGPHGRQRLWRLRYLPADVAWLASQPGMASRLEISMVALIKAMEGEHHLVRKSLYNDVLSTFGPGIIPTLIERVRNTQGEGWNPYPTFIASALAKIGQNAVEVVQSQISVMFTDSSAELQEVALRLAAKIPCPATLDRLWQIHKRHVVVQQEDQQKRERSYEALRTQVQHRPEWLLDRILSSNPQAEPIADLAFLLASVRGPKGNEIWHQTKEHLFAHVPSSGRRSLAQCLLRYRDTREISRVETWLQDEEDDFLGGFAFNALAAANADRALAHLKQVPLVLLHFMRGHWLPELLIQKPQETRQLLLGWMKEVSFETAWEVARLYEGHESEVDPETLDALLSIAEQAIDVNATWIHGVLRLLVNILTLEGIRQFRSRAGTAFENKLADIACQWVTTMTGGADDLESATGILLKIGGEGFTRVVNARLASRDAGLLYTTFTWVPVRPNDETIQHLIRFCLDEKPETTRAGTVPRHAYDSIAMLAELEQNAAVILTILKWGHDIVTDQVVTIRRRKMPMSDSDLQSALNALPSDNISVRANGVLAVGCSGRTDLIPRLYEIVRREQPASGVALEALFALHYLGERGQEFTTSLERQLSIPDRLVPALNMLIAVNTTEAWDIIERVFVSGQPPLGELKPQIGRMLCKREDRKARCLPLLWAGARDATSPINHYSQCYEQLIQLDDPAIRDFLWNEVYEGGTGIHYVGRTAAALQALAKLDPERAFVAAENEFSRGARDRELLLPLLLDMNPSKTIPMLCSQLKNEQDVFMQWEIGRSLRTHADRALVSAEATVMLQSLDSAVRKAGAELCGWMGPGFLSDALRAQATVDSDPDVRMAARDSLQRQRKEDEAERLIQQVGSALPVEQWGFMTAIIQLVDPAVLVHGKEPFDFAKVAREMPVLMLDQINRHLRKSRERLKRNAESISRKE